MFDISWSELLILAVVTLIFVGPKELPKFLNTMGRYAGMVRRQAAEFRAQFDEAMRQAELDALKKEVAELREGVDKTVRDAQADAPKPALPVEEPKPIQATLPLGRSVAEITAPQAAPGPGGPTQVADEPSREADAKADTAPDAGQHDAKPGDATPGEAKRA